MREWYQNYRPRGDTQLILVTASDIIKQYQAQGLRLTLRQLYYQFVARDLVPNTEKSYKKLGMIISKGRLGGYLDWDAIEDRVRVPVVWAEYNSVDDVLDEALRRYRLPRQAGQRIYVELWVEKDALAGVLQPVAAEYHVTMMVNRGYSSSSAMKDAGDRLRKCCDKYGCSQAMVLYLGDLDPSGEDMVRDIRERLDSFLNEGVLIVEEDDKDSFEKDADREERKPYILLRVDKLALTMDQVDEYDPPPNPTKLSDSRAKNFIAQYGDSSWEVDALEPTVLQELITNALEEVLDMDVMNVVKKQERKDQERLRKAVKNMRK
jgi:hypothetical protein